MLITGHRSQEFSHHSDDDDAGIDERFDGPDYDNVDEEENVLGEFTSPRAAGPLPIDTSFVPQQGKKYFSVMIAYPAVRAALRARGWIEVGSYKKPNQIAGYSSSPGKHRSSGNDGPVSRQCDQNLDLKFCLSAADANHTNLRKSCLIN